MSAPIEALRIAKHGEAWRKGHLAFLLSHRFRIDRNDELPFGGSPREDQVHLDEAVAWLERAQDATPDGGFVGRYRLDRGWTSSYPETTGYIVPTMLRLWRETGEKRYFDRAERAIRFLLELQLENGAFPGAEIAENADKPSPFNTGQILHGLIAWHRETGEEAVLEAAKRAGDWLVEVQDADGAYRKHFYYDVATAYATHLTCWLAELGQHTGEKRYLDAVGRHIDWVLTQHVPETDWFDRAGFDKEQLEERKAFTHTIAYTIWGVLFSAQILGREDAIQAARDAAYAVLRRFELSKRLPGILDWQWKSRGDFCCLTGNAQMALIWMRLYDREPDPRLLNAAFGAIDEIRRRQNLSSSNGGLRGGIPGSFPVWGDYIRMGVPNWAAKYFVDALLEKRRILASLELPVASGWTVPQSLPRRLPEVANVTGTPPKFALLTTPNAKKVAHLLAETDAFDWRPSLVLVEQPPEPSRGQRLAEVLKHEGRSGLLARFGLGKPANYEPASVGAAGSQTPSVLGALEECRKRGLEVVVVPSVNDPKAIEALKQHGIDLCVHAGAGILRQPLLEACRLGVLNAHMGLLPKQRGMNVTEWAALQGEPIGCTVHLVDQGIDTGAILSVHEVDLDGIDSIASLRQAVDREQLRRLAETLRFVVESGGLPAVTEQSVEDGVQCFRMHRELKSRLESWLASGGLQKQPKPEPASR